jgi:3',5'-cyclic AMP phosphodiesterase CpdA
MRLAVTADLHWGLRPRGDEATLRLRDDVLERQPDVLLILGDVAENERVRDCLSLFTEVEAARLVVAGNHDLWTRRPSPRSRLIWELDFPEAARSAGFHDLETGNWLSPDGRLAIAGSINWYDYTFADPELEREDPRVKEDYLMKLFPDGIHVDGRLVRLGISDPEFTNLVVRRLQRRLRSLPQSVEQLVVGTHHPALRELFWPEPPATLGQRYWLAYTGNRRMDVLVRGHPLARWVFSGHTHREVTADVGPTRALNVGGDYDWKRLLLVDTDTGEETAFIFGRE